METVTGIAMGTVMEIAMGLATDPVTGATMGVVGTWWTTTASGVRRSLVRRVDRRRRMAIATGCRSARSGGVMAAATG
jgi:hypothetical protein